MGFGGPAEGGDAGEADLGGERGEPDRLVLQQRFNALHAPAVEQHVRALAVGAVKEAAQMDGGDEHGVSNLVNAGVFGHVTVVPYQGLLGLDAGTLGSLQGAWRGGQSPFASSLRLNYEAG